MALENFAVVQDAGLQDEVTIEFWNGPDRCTAVLAGATFDDTFDPRLHYGPLDRRVSGKRRVQFVQENREAFGRIVGAIFERKAASSPTSPRQIEITQPDIQGSGEKFTRDALLDAGLASRSTGTQRSAK
jgi:hypothetical protein